LYKLYNSFLFPSAYFIIDVGDDKPDGNAETYSPPNTDTSPLGTEIVGEGDTDNPKANDTGNHRKESCTGSS
jgi:hypothetical protein